MPSETARAHFLREMSGLHHSSALQDRATETEAQGPDLFPAIETHFDHRLRWLVIFI